ncbi:MAG: dTDP-4-dehydrorhamnose reductase [Gammaproteobacteria bacterium]|nr:dTDP-4-dehydrorhamnose reductase [Gammaproteobacteria bacterium]MBU2058465.1 dTDP-4-dehydrorhamnose reductase [Gammaproteobacteria bacterium]MBU2176482.1 dTDP-4-dehydrorhamnose reductase [Gammaproteobacteria bacterium]MBU2248576.1 dTDP-4-dehydrorhamnose reductase [Gammaproteobacteria bacterium]MBU2345561.1 dTDP-4-dehydrorhamnose reductase [Gammaproteobacteria bacterium]
MLKVLLLGQSGQLASELQLTMPVSIQLKVLSYAGFCILSDAELNQIFLRYKPDWVINAVAYNQVDQAELSPELAMAGNFYLVQKLQRFCALTQSKLLHISTDYVFDGTQFKPYKESDRPKPLNHYGNSKLLAEQWLLQQYAESSVIIRTSWLYSAFGSNFVKTMLQLMQSKVQLQVVQDQIGSPCWAYSLACVIWQIIAGKTILAGVYHWADSGYCSRYEFAAEIQALALQPGLLSHKAELVPVNSEQFNSPAARPAFSALDSTLLRASLSLPEVAWQQQLLQALQLFTPASMNNKD